MGASGAQTALITHPALPKITALGLIQARTDGFIDTRGNMPGAALRTSSPVRGNITTMVSLVDFWGFPKENFCPFFLIIWVKFIF